MKHQRLMTGLLLILFCFLLTGCLKGEITLHLNENGTADLKYGVIGVDFIENQINAMKEDAKKNGMITADLQEGTLRGFRAEKHFEDPLELQGMKFFASHTENNRGLVIERAGCMIFIFWTCCWKAVIKAIIVQINPGRMQH
ncbi:hypothetical protein [Sporomusa sp.]|uniref:hypothetical protein n=1 Tax=Sporomusa sp. TaxID=2078658 RepID=UPI002C83559C|nr:hypothetical protein [Sporomusa sp.]HWR09711.1 hypothetical protein [Sporomusa sp.]